MRQMLARATELVESLETIIHDAVSNAKPIALMLQFI